jgi:hypothetical protein
VDVLVETVIEVAPDLVAAYAGDPTNATTKDLARLKEIVESRHASS